MNAGNMDRDSDIWLVGLVLQGDISLLNVAVRLQVSVLALSKASQDCRQCGTVGCIRRTVMSSLLQLLVMHGTCIRRTAEPIEHQIRQRLSLRLTNLVTLAAAAVSRSDISVCLFPSPERQSHMCAGSSLPLRRNNESHAPNQGSTRAIESAHMSQCSHHLSGKVI